MADKYLYMWGGNLRKAGYGINSRDPEAGSKEKYVLGCGGPSRDVGPLLQIRAAHSQGV